MDISSGGVLLRPWRIEDAAALAKIADNRKIADNIRDSFPSPYSVKDAKKWIRKIRSIDPILNFAIVSEGEIAGNIGLVPKDNIYRKNIEIGYFVGEEYWGRGIATNAIRAIISYTFNTFDVVRIYAEVFADNTASCRVLEKAGFTREAVLNNYIFKNEVLRDGCIYSLLKVNFMEPV